MGFSINSRLRIRGQAKNPLKPRIIGFARLVNGGVGDGLWHKNNIVMATLERGALGRGHHKEKRFCQKNQNPLIRGRRSGRGILRGKRLLQTPERSMPRYLRI